MAHSETLSALLQANGGLARWQQVRRITARLSSGGLAFALKGQPHALEGLMVELWPHEPRVVLGNFGGGVGEWTPWKVTHAGVSRASGVVHAVKWDLLDVLTFAGQAVWNYLSFPWVLTLPGVSTQFVPGQVDAVFPVGFATHSPQQSFFFDEQGALVRHDYTALAMARLATAANLVTKSEWRDGLRFATRRRVVPRLLGRVMPGPTLVWIELDDLQVEPS